jgi:hypothetical protein
MNITKIELIITREDAPAETRPLAPGEFVIGRGAEADIRIATPHISRKHARLTVREADGVIEDLGSANGTTLDGQPVTRATVLRAGQTIRLGPVSLVLRHEAAAPESQRPVAERRAILLKILPPELLLGKKYEPGKVVAQGGMGAILSAKEPAIDRTVAMKVMLNNPTPADLLRFVSEAKITGQLEHPNIVPVHELGVDERAQVFYTMKYVRGITLQKVLDLIEEGIEGTIAKYPLGSLLTVFQKVCDALAFAHSKGVIHRDLKPENIMIGDFGEVLVMDWGLAKVLDPTRSKAASGADGRSIIRTGVRKELEAAEIESALVLGTPQYMAPEQCWNAHDKLDQRTDVYALGAILYHILTLRPSIEGDEPQAVLSKAARGEIVPPMQAARAGKRLPHLPGGRVPEALSAVTMKAMALHQEARYPGVPELQADIEAYQNGFATGAENAGPMKQLLMGFKRSFRKTNARGK